MTRQTTHWQVKSLSLGNIIGRPIKVTVFCENAPTMWDQHRLKGALKPGDPQGLHSEKSVKDSPSWFRSNPENILAHRLYLWTVQNTRLLNCSQNGFNSSSFKGLSIKSSPLKGLNINSSPLKGLNINSSPLKGLSINSSPLKGLIVVWLYNP